MLAEVDRRFYGCDQIPPTRHEILEQMIPYVESQIADGASVWHIARHMLGLFQGQPRGKLFRRFLSENCAKNPTKAELLLEAGQLVRPREA